MKTAVTTNPLEQYECGAFRFTGQADHQHYYRHLGFAHVISRDAASEIALRPCRVD